MSIEAMDIFAWFGVIVGVSLSVGFACLAVDAVLERRREARQQGRIDKFEARMLDAARWFSPIPDVARVLSGLAVGKTPEDVRSEYLREKARRAEQ